MKLVPNMTAEGGVRVGFVGLTHLGIVSSAAVAERGFDVVCVDPNRLLISDLNSGALPVQEPGLDELVASNRERMRFTSDFSELASCSIVYISMDVPTDDLGRSALDPIRDLCKTVVPHLPDEGVLVVLCQVPPGFTRSLTAIPHKRLVYQVETLVFGRAVERALHPERFIIGLDDSTGPIPEPLKTLLESFGCPILPMGYESAELAKISINMCLVASVSVANTMAEICESVGADWSEIVPALRLDRRIGQFSYLQPGLGIAGGNLERDLATVIQLSEAHNTDGGVVRAWLGNSRHRRNWVADKLLSRASDLGDTPAVGVWGLAYKEETHSIKNSPSLATIRQIPQQWPVFVHDPVVTCTDFGRADVYQRSSPLDVLADCDVLLIMTPWNHYRTVSTVEIASRMRGRLVLDPFAVLDATEACQAGLEYMTLGVSSIDKEHS